MATPIRVLCVDDHRLMREGIARILGVQPDMTGVAEAIDGLQPVGLFEQRFEPFAVAHQRIVDAQPLGVVPQLMSLAL